MRRAKDRPAGQKTLLDIPLGSPPSSAPIVLETRGSCIIIVADDCRIVSAGKRKILPQ